MSLELEKYQTGALEADYTLLEACYTYVLLLKDYDIDGDLTLDIAAPLRWNELLLRLERTENHGVIFTRGKDGDEIGFEAGEGQQEIEAFYALFGPDGIGYVKEYVSDGGAPVLNYEAQVSFKDRRKEGQITYLKITRKSLRDKLLNRWDSKIDLSDTKALDGTTDIAPPTVQRVSLPSVGINQKYKADSSILERVDYTTVYQGGNIAGAELYIHMNTLQPKVSEIDTHYGYSLSVSTSYPPENDLYNWRMLASGNYHFELSLNFDLNIFLHRNNDFNRPFFQAWSIKWFLSVNGTLIQIGDTVTGDTINAQELGLKHFEATYDAVHYINQGAKVYLFGTFFFNTAPKSTKKIDAYIQSASFSYKVSGITTALPTVASGLYLDDTLEGLVRSATDNEIGIKSSFYDRAELSGNCGANRGLLTGFAARGGKKVGDDEDLPIVPRLSVKEALDSLKAIDCIGWNLEYDAADGEVLAVEPVGYFYQNHEIMVIEKIENFIETTQSAVLYAKVQIGYKTYADEGEQAKEDFNTLHTYQTPLREGEGTYEAISDLSASGILLEQTRRQQFEEGDQTGNSNDDTVFIVCVKPQTDQGITATLEFRAVFRTHENYDPETNTSETVDEDPGNSFLIVNPPDFMVVGGEIIIDGSASNDGTYHILYTEYISDIDKWAITVAELIVIESAVSCDVDPVSYPLVPETNESFDVTAGLSDPSTSLNLRINPCYMLANHGLILNSSLSYNGAGSKLKSTEPKQNQDMVIQRKLSEPCLQGDTGRSSFRMGDDVQLSKLTGFTRLFTPENPSFSTDFTLEQFMYIVNRHIGKEEEDKYGYLTVNTPCGEGVYQYVAAYVKVLEFNPITLKMTGELIKKKS